MFLPDDTKNLIKFYIARCYLPKPLTPRHNDSSQSAIWSDFSDVNEELPNNKQKPNIFDQNIANIHYGSNHVIRKKKQVILNFSFVFLTSILSVIYCQILLKMCYLIFPSDGS